MDIYVHNINRISIKDPNSDLDISLKKWDSLFEFLLVRTNYIYFIGNRLDFIDNNLKSSTEFLVDNNQLIESNDFNKLGIRVKLSSIILNRGLINQLWKYYEYPSLVFLTKELSQHDFLRLFKSNYNEEIFSFIEGGYLVYKSFETDVLWIERTLDMETFEHEKSSN